MISHIVAMSSNRVIGRDGKIPWDIPDDLKYFRNITLGHCVILGRKTFETLKTPLVNRLNVVISKNFTKSSEISVFSDVSEAIEFCKNQKLRPQEIFICGGSQIYKQTLNITQRIYLTYVYKHYNGDVFYPEFESDFNLVSEKTYFDPEHFSFRIYDRI